MRALLVAGVVCLALEVQPALAQSNANAREREVVEVDGPSRWDPEWGSFDAADAVIIAVAESAAFAVYLAQPVTEPLWTSRLPLDDDIRSVLRITDQDLRSTMITASDALFILMLAWPIAVDAVLLAGIVRGEWDVALQMALLDVEVLAVAQMATWLASRLSGRVRPEAVECSAAGTCSDTGVGPVASFVGGHSLMSFASAGLTCTQQLESPWIAGNTEAAAMTCASGLALATTIGLMRIGVDRHWASDVAIGSAMGAAIGFGLPYLLRYGRLRGTAPPVAIAPGVAGEPGGVTVFGMF